MYKIFARICKIILIIIPRHVGIIIIMVSQGVLIKKIYLLFLILVVIHCLKIHQQSPNKLRLRKSIHALNETERKSLMWCLKMLIILPAPQPFTKWTYQSYIYSSGDNPIQPDRVIDILISSHSSSCEHSNLYFAYYHRHLMVLAEIWLNFAHDILKNGKDRLLQLYPSSFYYQYSKYWDSIFEDYRQSGMSELSEVSLHYWNPTNYKNKYDLLIPEELASPHQYSGLYASKKIEVIDKLCHAILRQWPWEINIKTRLVSDEYVWNEEQVLQNFNMNTTKLTQVYTPNEMNLRNGKLTPRMQPKGQDFDDFYETIKRYQTLEDPTKTFEFNNGKRFKKYYDTVGNHEKIPISSIKEQQIYILYGAQLHSKIDGQQKKIKNQYISKAERIQNNLSQELASSYNNLMPHYRLAYALFNQQHQATFKNFIQKGGSGIETSHRLMHNSYGLFLQDSLYAASVLFFYTFHSWIDTELEIKIRMSNIKDKNIMGTNYQILKNELQNDDKESYYSRFNKYLSDIQSEDIKSKAREVFQAQINRLYQNITKYYEQSFPSIPKSTSTGYYLVMDWINPYVSSKLANNQTLQPQDILVGAFPMRDYIITPKHIRSGRQLSEIYHSIYIKNNGWRYKGLIDLDKFPFDYDYEMYYGSDRQPETLNDDGSNLPQYLLDMRDEVQETYDILDAALESTVDQIYNNNFSNFYIDKSRWKALYDKDPTKLKENLQSYYKTFLYNNSFTYVSYPISKEKGKYPIKMRLHRNQKCLHKLTQSLLAQNVSDETIHKLKGKGVQVQALNIKSNNKGCFKCHQENKILLDLGADLLDTNQEIWKVLRLIQLGDSPVLADSQNGTRCIAKQLEFIVGEQLNHETSIKAKYLKGAEQVNLSVQIEGVPQDQKVYFQNALSVSITSAPVGVDEKHELITVRSQAQDLLGAKFNFPPEQPRKHPKVANQIAVSLYRNITVDWQNKVTLTFEIPYYSKLFNFKIIAGFEEDNFQGPYLRIQDADFIIKKNFLMEIISIDHSEMNYEPFRRQEKQMGAE